AKAKKEILLDSGERMSPALFQTWPEIKSLLSACFIDGGNAPIYETANLSVHLIRTAAIIFHDGKYCATRNEFYSCVTRDQGEYSIKTFPDQTLGQLIGMMVIGADGKRVKIVTIQEIIRRITELKLAAKMADDSDMVLLDGSLEPNHDLEAPIISSLPAHVYGLSKTTSLGVQNGLSLGYSLMDLSPTGVWLYPIQESPYFISMIKLHKNSKHVFRLDSFSKPQNEILAVLTQNSRDPVFLGYPYGLVQADELARVSNSELDMLRTKFMVKTSSLWKEFEKEIRSVDAHTILDSK
ncbi:MAG: DNA double-strand break repair nuclease NurA, partial [Nanoarchaeota archaeon]|nr:DNA double-strand break repair nuclease NurA [Nanoarchaeota archaeon]